MLSIGRRVLAALVILLSIASPIAAHPSGDERLAILDARITAHPDDPSALVDEIGALDENTQDTDEDAAA